MIAPLDLVIIFVTHFIYDFVFQSREIATLKSSNIKYLLTHLSILMFGFMFSGFFITGLTSSEWGFFILLNLVLHGIIDWNIWKAYKYSVHRRYPDIEPQAYEYYNDSWFYSFIGLDQMLHNIFYVVVYIMLLALRGT